jgi:NADH-quinone oxidoreductase subunit N
MSLTLLPTAPLWITAVGATALLLLVAQRRDAARARRFAALVFGLAAASALLCLLTASTVAEVTPLLRADGAAQLLALLFGTLGLGSVLLPAADALSPGDQHDEFYLLALLAVLGAMLLGYAEHAATLVLGLELLSISMYGLIAYPAARRVPLEAALKYLMLSGAATATLLFGLALLYAGSGDLSFSGLVAPSSEAPNGLVNAGAALVLAALSVKAAVVPFQLWTPDVYEGAPTPVAALLVAVTKAAAIFALYRLGFAAGLLDVPAFGAALPALAVLSILVGNWMALLQTNLKRLLAFSSIAHSGYLMVGLATGAAASDRSLPLEAGAFYLLTYIVASYAAFAVLAHIDSGAGADSRPELSALNGLLWRAPLPAVLLLLALLSMAGIPLTAGFIGKLYLFTAAAATGQTLLMWAIAIGTAIGIYYYLRVVYALTLREEPSQPIQPLTPAWRGLSGLLITAILLLGIVPAPFMDLLGRLLR